MNSFFYKSKKDLKVGLNKAIIFGNTQQVKTILDYATENKIILELIEKNNYGNYPLLYATNRNNIEKVQLLIDYANKNNIILELNEKDKNGYTPIFAAMQNNNIEMFKLLVEYSIEKGIKLIVDESDIEIAISKNIHIVN